MTEPTERVVCFCVWAAGQSCPACDPEGLAHVVRPELSVRIIG